MDAPAEVKEPDQVQSSPKELLADAEDAINTDHDLTILQAIKLYPKACAWSMVLSAALIMDGYDYHVIPALYALPSFQKKFGHLQPNGSYAITAAWQSGLSNGSTVGQLPGLFLAGYLTERFGFRKTLMLTLAVIPCIIFIQLFAPSLAVLEVGRILLVVPLGLLETITIVYAVEVAPTCLRGFLTSYVSQMWVVGQTLSAAVGRSVINMEGSRAYRLPFAIQWIWPLPVLVAVFFAPESPWWLVRRNRLEEAKKSLMRLTSRHNTNFNLDKTIALMVLTTEHEREMNSSTTYVACFKGVDLRRTTIVIALYCMQIASGTTLRAYATYFFEQAGLATDWSFNMSIITYMLSFVGTVITWFLMPYVGRRTLFIWGLVADCVLYFVLGGLGVPTNAPNLSWSIASLLVVNGFIGYLCIEPIVFSLAAEVPSSVLRSKSVALGRIVYQFCNIAASVIAPYQISSSAWNWGAKSGFFWGGFCVIALVYSYFCLPETKDRTVTEIDLLFEKKVPARKFSKTTVYASEAAMHVK